MSGLFERLAARARGDDDATAVRPLVVHPLLDAEDPPIDALAPDLGAGDGATGTPDDTVPINVARTATQVARLAHDRPLVPPGARAIARPPDHRGPDDAPGDGGPRTRPDQPIVRRRAPEPAGLVSPRAAGTAPHAGARDPVLAGSSHHRRLADPDAGALAAVAHEHEPRTSARGIPAHEIVERGSRSLLPGTSRAAAREWSDLSLLPEGAAWQTIASPVSSAAASPATASAHAAQRAGSPPARPVVKVTIGRVEIHAVPAPGPAVRPRPPRREAPSLADYLAHRDGDGQRGGQRGGQ